MAQVVVIGAGYVGLTTAACISSLGHHVSCVDIDEAKIDRLNSGHVDILEEGLPAHLVSDEAMPDVGDVGGVTLAVVAADRVVE